MRRYRVEWLINGAWVPTDAFEQCAAATAWAHTLLQSEEPNPERGVRVVDSESPLRSRERVVWSVEG